MIGGRAALKLCLMSSHVSNKCLIVDEMIVISKQSWKYKLVLPNDQQALHCHCQFSKAIIRSCMVYHHILLRLHSIKYHHAFSRIIITRINQPQSAVINYEQRNQPESCIIKCFRLSTTSKTNYLKLAVCNCNNQLSDYYKL